MIYLIISIFIYSLSCSAQELTLPIYTMSIDPAYIDSLEANPASANTYPAIIEFENIVYTCQVRYRGGTSLNLPKRSWKIYFDNSGPVGQIETNLNAEYRDKSLCRNHLSYTLANISGLPAPVTNHVSYIVNEVYYGVYLEVEQVDEIFFENRELGCRSLFKAFTHGARYTPPMFCEEITRYYDPKFDEGGGLDSLGKRFIFYEYGESEDVAENIEGVTDVSNAIDFFAFQYCIGNSDGFTKNNYTYLNDSGQLTIVPWDCDGTFGNNWEGNYYNSPYTKVFICFDQNALAQRLISIPDHRSELLERIEEISSEGFDDILDTLSQTYFDIRHDVYLDTLKRGTNEEFEQEYLNIADYIEDRSEFLEDFDWFHRIEVDDIVVYPDYISSLNETVHFRARISEPAHSVILNLVNFDDEYEIVMNDEGLSGDSIAGDSIYSINLTMEDYDLPIFYGFQANYSNSEGYPTPFGGWLLFYYFQVELPTIRLDTNPPLYNDVSIGNFYAIPSSDTYYFELLNTSGREINISGCVVRIGQSFRLLRLSEIVPLAPNEKVFITNHKDQLCSLEPGTICVGNLYYTPIVGDTIFITTSSGINLTSKVVDYFIEYGEVVNSVVINEINYNSCDEFDPGDWVELTALEGPVDLSGWRLKDNQDDHYYIIPSGTILEESEFLVIAQYPEDFSEVFPSVISVIGGFEFGFSGSGDEIRLFNDSQTLIDWVIYDDESPWPTICNGNGPTLELINPNLPNSGHINWAPSEFPDYYGTPGDTNSAFDSSYSGEENVIPETFSITEYYPNPFNSRINIIVSCPNTENIELKIYDILGRLTTSLKKEIPAPGYYHLFWNGTSFDGKSVASGVYFITADNSSGSSLKKIVWLK